MSSRVLQRLLQLIPTWVELPRTCFCLPVHTYLPKVGTLQSPVTYIHAYIETCPSVPSHILVICDTRQAPGYSNLPGPDLRITLS
ncbi:hypothetical protein F4776DRAFT_369802 [Hypoxylon sp. NC0597]|nr:hypothetical protein F4776DRAFT_369802 [Hypoxylon sp. NC0597]